MPPPTSCSPSTPFLFTVSLVLSIHSFLLFLSFSLCISSSWVLGVVGLRWFFVDRGSLRWFVVGLCGGSVSGFCNLILASEDAKKLVDEERAFAFAEIENARAAVQRVEEALQEHERTSRASGKQDVGELMKEVQEARRIIMLHQPSKLAKSKRVVENGSQSFELDGHEALGSYLRIQPCSDNAPELSKCSIQWYRVSSEGGKKELISGATKSVYAPEPFDVGRILQADIVWEGQQITLTTAGPIDPAAGLGSHVEALVRKHDIEFNVVVTQMNGVNHPSESIHVLHVGRMRIKLCKAKTTIAKEYYSTSMQLCGVRGGGNAAAQALFWQAKKGLSFVVAFESERERNAAIMLARRFAFDCNIMLAGPDDRAPLGT